MQSMATDLAIMFEVNTKTHMKENTSWDNLAPSMIEIYCIFIIMPCIQNGGVWGRICKKLSTSNNEMFFMYWEQKAGCKSPVIEKPPGVHLQQMRGKNTGWMDPQSLLRSRYSRNSDGGRGCCKKQSTFFSSFCLSSLGRTRKPLDVAL